MKTTWRKLNDNLAGMTEDEVLDALNHELDNLKRVSILERLHQRYCALRSTRERIEILSKARAL